jgi:Protein of unknown function (DUF3261)
VRTALTMALLGAGCASLTPRPTSVDGNSALLALPPASLGRELHLAQRITVERAGQRVVLDAQLEADAQTVNLAAFVLGQTVARLSWNGVTLEETHSSRVPEVVTPARILSDVQLAFWPTDAVRAGLPPGYTLDELGATRTVLREGRPFETVVTVSPQRSELEHLAFGYRLLIESHEQVAQR